MDSHTGGSKTFEKTSLCSGFLLLSLPPRGIPYGATESNTNHQLAPGREDTANKTTPAGNKREEEEEGKEEESGA